MVQFMIFKIFNDNKHHTLSRLYNLFDDKLEVNNEKNIVFLPFNYSNKSKILIKKAVKELDLEKYIFTNDIFYNILRNLNEDTLILQNILLSEELDECSEYLRECINKLNNPNLKSKENFELTIDEIINELEWASAEEDIDVKYIELRIKSKIQNFYFKIDKYGEIDMDYIDMKLNVLDLINKSIC